jgi:hypothetical protein
MVSESEELRSRPKRKEHLIGVAAVLVLILLLSSLVGYGVWKTYNPWPRYSNDDYSYDHVYYLHIFPASSGNYSILCPVPITRADNLSHPQFIDDLHADSASVNLSMETTEHGVALNISGSGYVNITWANHWPSESGKFYGTLSMLSTYDFNASSAIAFIKSSGTAVGISIDYSARSQYGYGASHWNYISNSVAAEDGWHEAFVEIQNLLVN